MSKNIRILAASYVFLTATFAVSVFGQTTAFSYQGFVKDGIAAANGNYDFEFRLYSAVSGGSQIDSTNFKLNVPVTNGHFSVLLDFNAAGFTGPDRYLDIRLRPSGTTTYTTLTPRSFVASAPYAVQAVTATNALLLGNVPAANYLQSGSATVSAGTQYNLGGNRILAAPATENTFVGINSGLSNTSSTGNTFFGFSTGQDNSTGGQNTAVGARSGQNTIGFGNTFFGYNTGNANTSGSGNSFFGNGSGDLNTASDNSFFGNSAGGANTTGIQNSFFGKHAGLSNVTATENSYFGFEAGRNSTGSFNSFLGSRAGQANTSGSSNSFFGTAAGVATTTGGDNAFFGVNTGSLNTTGTGNSYFGRRAGRDSTGSNNTAVGIDAGRNNLTGSNNTFIGAGADASVANLTFATAIGAGATVSASNTVVIGNGSETIQIGGSLNVDGRGTIEGRLFTGEELHVGNMPAGDRAVCYTWAGDLPPGNRNRIGSCSSSILYKDRVVSIPYGGPLISKLRPVSYVWKRSGRHSIGLIAEEVNEVEPVLAEHNSDGSVSGVNYNAVTAVLIKAVQEQQLLIDGQQKEINKLAESVKLLIGQTAKQSKEIATLKRSRVKPKGK